MAVASGGYAEYCTSASTGTKLLHSNLTFEEGAGVGIPYYTAYRALVIKSVLIFSCLKNLCKNLSLFVGGVIFKDMTFCFYSGGAKPGETVLIHGASGAVCIFCTVPLI